MYLCVRIAMLQIKGPSSQRYGLTRLPGYNPGVNSCRRICLLRGDGTILDSKRLFFR